METWDCMLKAVVRKFLDGDWRLYAKGCRLKAAGWRL